MTKRLAIVGLQPDSKYSVQVRAKTTGGNSEWSQSLEFSTIKDTNAPLVPQDIAVSPVGTSFLLTWATLDQTGEVAQNNDFAYYEVTVNHVATSKAVQYTVPASSHPRFDFTLEQNEAAFGTPKGQLQFWIKSVDTSGNKSNPSAVVTGTNATPAAPTALTAVGLVESVSLEWDSPADTDVVGYKVYSSTVSGFTPGTGNLVTNVEALSYLFSASTTAIRYFKVSSVDIFGQESTTFASVSGTPKAALLFDTIAPAVPAGLTGSITTDAFGIATANITWTANVETDLAEYILRYRRVGTTNYTTAVVNRGVTFPVAIPLQTAYVNYEFQVAARDFQSNTSSYTSTLTLAGGTNAAPATVTGLAVVASRESLTATWAESADQDVKNGYGTYEYQIATNTGFTTGLLTFKTGSTSISVSGLTPATTYYSRVRAVDSAGLPSAAWSSTVTSLTGTYAGLPTSDGIAPSSSPAATVVNGIGFLSVNWLPIANNDAVTYEIHLSTTSGFTPAAGTKWGEVTGTFSIIETLPQSTSPLAYGTTYYVKIIAKDRDGAAAPGTQGSGTPSKVSASDSNLNAGDVGAPTTGEFTDLTGKVNESVKGVVTEYAVNSSETTAPTTGWSSTTPARTPGTFTWYRAVVTYTDNTVTTSSAALLTGNTGSTGSQGIQGPTGSNGVSLYTWLKYSDTPTTGMNDLPAGKAYIGIAYNKTSPTESSNYGDYQWSLILGDDGADGRGITGTTVTYQTGSSGTTAPTGTWQSTPTATVTGQFLWTRTITSYTDATTSTAYAVSAHGATGSTGGTGAAGKGISNTVVTYQAHTNATAAPSGTWAATPVATTTGQFLWTRTVTTFTDASTVTSYAISAHGATGSQGNQGIQGPIGPNGLPTYTWIKYGTSGTGADLSDDPAGKTHIGIAYNKTTQTESETPGDYQWALIQGPQGTQGPTGPQGSQGIQGPTGPNGQTFYTWIKYADSPTTGMVDLPAGKTYMGIAYNKTSATESSTYGDYAWSLIKGSDGSQGIQGPAGANGQPTYTWIKYGTSDTGTGMSDDPTDKTYIGIAYNKTTTAESPVTTDYEWSLIQGPQGPQGDQGVAGTPAAIVSLTATTQVLVSPPAGGVTNPTTSVVTGTAINTTISVWTYSVNGAAFSTTVPAGVSRTNNVVTITGSTMTARTLTVRMADAAGIADTITVAKVLDGAQGPQGNTGGTGSTGSTGAPGADAYTVLLTNEADIFAGSPTAANAGSAATSVIAYKGAVQQAATIGTVTGQVTGLTTAITNNGTANATVTITVTTALTTLDGLLTIPITVDGKAFTKTFSWSVSRQGIQGNVGPQGSQGIQGPTGPNGQTFYTWIKYADTPTTGMDDLPAGKTYMGIAYNKASATESSTYGDYQWSLIQGAPGADGSDGSDGKGISGTVVTYQTGSSGTTAPTGTWNSAPTATTTGQFLWTRTITTYTDATTSTAYSVSAHGSTGTTGSTGSTGAAGRGVAGTTVTYQVHTNGTTAPTGSWLTTIPATATGQFLWTRTITTYTDALNPTTAYAVSAHGATGSQGNQGIQGPIGPNGLPTYTWIKYAPNGNPTTGQISDVPDGMTHIGIAYNKTTQTETTVPGDYQWALIQGPAGIDGIDGSNGSNGADGIGITGTVVTYQTGTSGTTAPTGSWVSAPTATTTGQFLWTRTITSYTSGTPTTAYAVSAHGATGSTGSTGGTGAAGRGISNTVVNYQVGTTGTTAPTGTWLTTIPVTTTGQFLWVRTVTNYTDAINPTTAYAVSAHGSTGATGAPGAPAAIVAVISTTQVLTAPAAGGATNPATATVTGTALNTTLTVFEYSVNGAAFSATVPAGVSRTGNVVTITGATMTARTIAVKMGDANGVSDTVTVAEVMDGAQGPQGNTGSTGGTGSTGAPGADAYTVILTNEAEVFAGNVTSANAGTATSSVIAYKGSVQQTATIGTITGQVTGLTTAITNNGTNNATVTMTVTTALVALDGILNIPVTVDGKTFTKTISWSVTRQGVQGPQGNAGSTGGTGPQGVSVSSVTPYFAQVTAGAAAPANPGTVATPSAPWVATEPGYVANTDLWRTERIAFSNTTYVYTVPSKVSSYAAASVAMATANGKNTINHSPSTPTTSNVGKAGDIWFVRADNTSPITAQYELTTSASPYTWVQKTLSDTVIANLSAGKLIAGDITSAIIRLGDGGILKTFNSEVTITETGIAVTGTNSSITANALTTGTFQSGNVLTVNGNMLLNGNMQVQTGGYIKSTEYAGTTYAAASTAGWYLGRDGLRISSGAVSATTLTAGTLGSSTGTIQIGAGANIVMNGGYLKSNSYTGTTYSSNPSGAGFYLGNDGLHVDGGSISANALSTGVITASNITLGIGATIKSDNYNQANRVGWQLGPNGLDIGTGTISAKSLLLQNGQNIIDPAYADFEFSPTFYTNKLNVPSTLVATIDGTNKIFNNQSLKLVGTGGIAYFGNNSGTDATTSTSFNAEANKAYIISFYAMVPTGAVATSITGKVRTGASTDVSGASLALPADNVWKRYTAAITLGATIPNGRAAVYVELPTTASTTVYLDGFQVEEQQTSATTASTWTPPGMTTVDANQITTGTISTDRLSADVATIDNLTSGFIMSGRIQVGESYWTPTEGLVIPQPDGGTITLPADGITDATITAKLVAKSLTVEGALDIRGVNNKISGGLVLSNGVTRPAAVPSISQMYPTSTIGPIEGSTPGLSYSCRGMTQGISNSDLFYFPDWVSSTNFRSWNRVTGETVRVVLGAGNWGNRFRCRGGITKLGSFFYVLGTDTSRDGNWYIYQLDSNLNKVEERFFSLAINVPTSGSVIGNDGANVIIAVPRQDDAVIFRVRADLLDGALANGRPFSQELSLPGLASTKLAYVGEGNYDFGSSRILLAVENNRIFHFTAAGVRNDADSFFAAHYTTLSGMDFIDGSFVSIDTNGVISTYSGIRQATTITASYTWYDSQGITRETQPSPSASYTLLARAFPRIETPSPPDSGNSLSNVDRANRVGIYIATAANARRLQTFLPVDPVTFLSTREYRATTISTTGKLEPTSNGFIGATSGSPGSVVSADGLASFNGDGTVHVKIPVAPTHAVNKSYVDDILTTVGLDYFQMGTTTAPPNLAYTVVHTTSPFNARGTATRVFAKAHVNSRAGGGNQAMRHHLEFSSNSGASWTMIDFDYVHNGGDGAIPLSGVMTGWATLGTTPTSALRFRTLVFPEGGYQAYVTSSNITLQYFR